MDVSFYSKKLEELWGKETTREFAVWLESVIREKAITKEDYRELIAKIESLQGDLDELTERQEHISAEIENLKVEVETKLEELSNCVDQQQPVFEKIEGKIEEVNGRFFDLFDKFDGLNERLEKAATQNVTTMKWTIASFVGMAFLLAVLMSVYKFMG